jgi:hypothetical protein
LVFGARDVDTGIAFIFQTNAAVPGGFRCIEIIFEMKELPERIYAIEPPLDGAIGISSRAQEGGEATI